MTTVAAPAAITRSVPRRRPTEHACRAALLVLLGALTTAAWLVGVRTSTYDDLRAGLRDGTVTDVTVTGSLEGSGALDRSEQGWVHPTLTWREGRTTHTTTVLQVARAADQGDATRADADTGAVVGGIVPALRAVDPGVRVEAREPHGVQTWATVGSYELPGLGWFAAWCVVVGLALGLLVSGTQPRWATRWGWFWVLAATDGTAFLLLLATFALAGWQAHVPGERRLNGWLAALVVAPALAAVT